MIGRERSARSGAEEKHVGRGATANCVLFFRCFLVQLGFTLRAEDLAFVPRLPIEGVVAGIDRVIEQFGAFGPDAADRQLHRQPIAVQPQPPPSSAT